MKEEGGTVKEKMKKPDDRDPARSHAPAWECSSGRSSGPSGDSRRWSGGGCIPTLERGNEGNEQLPRGWVSCALGDCCEIISGQHLGPDEYNLEENGIPYLTGPADFGSRIPSISRWTLFQRAVANSGDVLITVKGAGAGKVNFAIHAAISRQLMAIRPASAIRSDYLYYWLDYSFQELSRLGQGATVPGIGVSQIAKFAIPTPSIATQTAIVAKLEELLSDLDAGVAELKAAQKKLAQYRQSLLKAAVEGRLTAQWREERRAGLAGPGEVSAPPVHGSTSSPRTGEAETGAQLLERILRERRRRWEAKQLAKFKEQGKAPPKGWQDRYPEPVRPDSSGLPALPEGWVWASVDQLSESVRNGISKTPNTERRGFPIFKINAVRPMAVNFNAIKHIEIDESEAADYWVDVGDVLATRYNGSVDLLGVFGMVKDVPERTLHPDKLIRMKPVTGVKLGAWMEVCGNVGQSRNHLVSRVKTTAGQTGISGEDLKKTPIPFAPVTEQEVALALLEERLQAVNELARSTELGLNQSTAQRKNILKAAFSGQLVPQDPNDEPAGVLLERIRAERAGRPKSTTRGRAKPASA